LIFLVHLLDTSILVDILRKDEDALAWFASNATDARTSVISLTELHLGARRQKEERDLVELERLVRPLPVDRDIAVQAGAFIRHYGPSHSLEIPDAIIAATAEHHGLRLATLNVKHFPMFPKLKRAY
jgi:predicted nucleic acid-binding protein